MVKVVARPDENDVQLFRRFKKKVVRSGILSVVRRKRWHVPKSELKRIAKKKAVRRHRRRQRMSRRE